MGGGGGGGGWWERGAQTHILGTIIPPNKIPLRCSLGSWTGDGMISSSWSGHLGQNLQWVWRTRFRVYGFAFGVQGSAGHMLPFCRSFLGEV